MSSSSSVLKAVASASAIAFSVTMYHRSLRSFLPDKEKQQIFSSVVYFCWNLFLIMSRLTALALFASVLPCFIFTHFICSWLVLFVFAWRSKTDFMDSRSGEWLYRATVGLIWYFDWFNVVEGRTRYRTLLYHGYILADMLLLCSLWCWKMSTEQLYFKIPNLYAKITAVSVVVVYIFGLLFKIVYYKHLHPSLSKEELKGDGAKDEDELDSAKRKVENKYDLMWFYNVDGEIVFSRRSSQRAAHKHRYNRRMRKLAENFYLRESHDIDQTWWSEIY